MDHKPPYISAYAIFPIGKEVPRGFQSICIYCAKSDTKCTHKPNEKDGTILVERPNTESTISTKKKTVFVCDKFYNKKKIEI